MSMYTLTICGPMLVLLIVAAAEDLRSRRIANWLTLALMTAGVAQSFTRWHTVTPAMSLAGVFVGGAVPLVMFAIGALGGGDVKLMAGVGAWLGPIGSLEVFAGAAIVGMVIVLVQAAHEGRLAVLVRNSAMVAVNLAHAKDVGMEHVQATGQACRSVKKPLPYAVPVLVATLGVLALA